MEVPDGSSLVSWFQRTATRHATRPALMTMDGAVLHWSEYAEQVRVTAEAFSGLGLRRGDVVGCWLANRPEFHVADAAALHLGAACFSLDEGASVARVERLVAETGARVLVIEGTHVDAAIAVRARGRTRLEHIVCVGGDAPEALGWDELQALDDPRFDFEAAWRALDSQDLAALIYTSGATGDAKGVELTHGNVVAQALALTERLGLREVVRALSFLPMAHVAERLCTHYFPMVLGWQVTCCPEPEAVTAGLTRTRPGFFFSPPRLWERLRAAALMTADPDDRAALHDATARVRDGAAAQDGPAQQAARARLGLDAVEVALVGSAPCPRELLMFWRACGVPLSELYGLSETTGVATVAAPAQARIGTAGPALPGTEVRVTADGEILVRGPTVTRRYRRGLSPLDEAGWLRTGDLGVLEGDGHLRVIDRLSDLFAGSNGDRISPARVETALRSNARLIGQACLVGERRPYNIALLTLEPDAARMFAAEIDLPNASLARLAQSTRVLEAVQDEVQAANASLTASEKVKRFLLLSDEWLPGGDELTATMKLRRQAIAQKYGREIAAVYGGALGLDADVPLARRMATSAQGPGPAA